MDSISNGVDVEWNHYFGNSKTDSEQTQSGSKSGVGIQWNEIQADLNGYGIEFLNVWNGYDLWKVENFIFN